MPIQELIDFFNDRFHDDRVQCLPDEPLRLRGNRVVGHFHGYRIHSRFRAIAKAISRYTFGHDACARIVDAEGRPQHPQDLFDAASAGNVITHADRLNRLVHMLNYLVLSDHYERLFLRVDPRHVLAVRADHGRYFEDVLHRCGLAAAQVVITLDIPIRGTEADELTRGLLNYRRNGYRIGTLIDRTALALYGLDRLLRLAPDYARLDGTFVRSALARETVASDYLHVIEQLRDAGVTVIQDDVDTETQARFAAACGADLLSGSLIGEAADDVHWQGVRTASVIQLPARPRRIRFSA